LAGIIIRVFEVFSWSFWHSMSQIPTWLLILIDVSYFLLVLTILWWSQYNFLARKGIWLAYAITVLEVALISPRFFSDSEAINVFWEAPATTTVPTSPLNRDTTNSLGLETWHLTRLDPGLWYFPHISPNAREVDELIGGPSVFHNFTLAIPDNEVDSKKNFDAYIQPNVFRHYKDSPNFCPDGTAPSVSINSWIGSFIELDSFSTCRYFLVVLDSWAPGWETNIDGSEFITYRLNEGIQISCIYYSIWWFRLRKYFCPSHAFTNKIDLLFCFTENHRYL
jgi:hypothetical protein